MTRSGTVDLEVDDSVRVGDRLRSHREVHRRGVPGLEGICRVGERVKKLQERRQTYSLT